MNNDKTLTVLAVMVFRKSQLFNFAIHISCVYLCLFFKYKGKTLFKSQLGDVHDALILAGKHTPFRLSFLICRHGAAIQTMVFNSLHAG